MSDLLNRAHGAVALLVDDAVHVDLAWLAAAVALHLLSQVVRVRGWWTILRASCPGAHELRHRDVARAYFAGAGMNALLPARAGDVVKLAFLRRRIPGASYATLAATFVPETAFETFCGVALVAWVLARGFLPVPTVPGEVPALDVSLFLSHPVLAAVISLAIIAGAALLTTWARRRSANVVARLRQGLVIFRQPARFASGVASWQALGRCIRLGSLACFLAAFALPATLLTALLVMAAQGGGRIVPLAPVSAGLRIAMLSYGLVEITDQTIDPGSVTVFSFGVSAVLFVVGFAISAVLIGRELGTCSPRPALREARRRLHADGPAQPSATPHGALPPTG
jgi:hypothetical protein